MKTIEELMNTPHLLVMRTGGDGGKGEIHFGKIIMSVIWSNGMGWEHVSVSPYKRSYTPSWDDMCRIKDMFWHEDECVVQYHPPKAEYVNVVGNCLHLWRPLQQGLPVPAKIMV